MPTVYPLRTLEAKLQKVVATPSTEIDDGADNPKMKGLYVWRDETGRKWKWGPKPESYSFHDVETLAEAHHIMFLCPLCFQRNGGASGTHRVWVTFDGRDIPGNTGTTDADGKPSRWKVSGTSLDDLVLTPSILLDAKRPKDQGCHWHGFVGSSGIPPGHAG